MKLTANLDKTKYIRTPRSVDFDELRKRKSRNAFVSNDQYRSMLHGLAIGDLVSSDDRDTGGYVTEIMRDRFGIPVSVRVFYEFDDGRWGHDAIPVDDIDEYHSCNGWHPDGSFADDAHLIGMPDEEE